MANGKVTCAFLGADPSEGRNLALMGNRCLAYALLVLISPWRDKRTSSNYIWLLVMIPLKCFSSSDSKVNALKSNNSLSSCSFFLLILCFSPPPPPHPPHPPLPFPCFSSFSPFSSLMSSSSPSPSFLLPSSPLPYFFFISLYSTNWISVIESRSVKSKHFIHTYWISQSFWGHIRKENADYCRELAPPGCRPAMTVAELVTCKPEGQGLQPSWVWQGGFQRLDVSV